MSKVIHETSCCADKSTNCPTLRVFEDGHVEVTDDDGNVNRYKDMDQAWAVAEAIFHADDVVE